MSLFEKFPINKLRDLSQIKGGHRTVSIHEELSPDPTDLMRDHGSIYDSKGDCTIETGSGNDATCDSTTSSHDCPPTV